MSQWPAAAHQGLITLPSGLATADPTRFLSSLERLWSWPPGVHRVLENKDRVVIGDLKVICEKIVWGEVGDDVREGVGRKGLEKAWCRKGVEKGWVLALAAYILKMENTCSGKES